MIYFVVQYIKYTKKKNQQQKEWTAVILALTFLGANDHL